MVENRSLHRTRSTFEHTALRVRLGLRPWALAVCAAPFALAGCSDVPNPADYGGGDTGRAIAQCIERTEREDTDLTREQVGTLCTCLTERIASGTEQAMATGSVNRAEMERAMGRCAADAGIAVD